MAPQGELCPLSSLMQKSQTLLSRRFRVSKNLVDFGLHELKERIQRSQLNLILLCSRLKCFGVGRYPDQTAKVLGCRQDLVFCSLRILVRYHHISSSSVCRRDIHSVFV